ncbi:probable disease resistance protein At5g66900 [Prosopis cineraria]|uniref:probable disease resistance protein At5g66900 n=1 Tax=Prosopis cineraria TaxID=364024 RepID=UPI00240F5B04|nr:probable disease resistance protein At5g66900 [Prosopis cineraria]
MAGAVIGEAAAGVLLEGALRSGLNILDKALNFEPKLEDLRDTVQRLSPVIQQMKACDETLDSHLDPIERVLKEFQESDKLVRKYSNVRWWKSLSFPFYHDKIEERKKKLERAITVDMQVLTARDVKEILSTLSDLKDIMLTFVHNFSSDTVMKGLCGAPERPKYTVGLDGPLNNTKNGLLNGDEQVLVLTGLPGSGKTTMAKKLCWDPDIKGKFGENIFFVIFSKTPNLKNIVQTIFGHCGRQAPEFSSDEDAINRLGVLLRLFGRRPILLVLDDVWQGSETLVEKFKFQIPDYKVLVTSRFTFPRFVTSCHLEALGHDDAIRLFHHFSLLDDSSSYKPDKKLVHEVVRGCKGSPLAIEVIGGLLCKQPFEVWEKMKELLLSQSIFDSNTDLLHRLQTSLEVLGDKFPIKKECFMDLGLFPEDKMIPVDTLIDMWAEQYKLDEDGIQAMAIIHELTTSNLARTVVRRKAARETDKYYNNHFVLLHDLLRELAIHQSSQVPMEERRRLIIDSGENNHPEWWQEQKQQGVIARISSLLFGWWMEQERQQVSAHSISIYADDTSSAEGCSVEPDEAKVLILNLESSNYTIPRFVKKMRKLNVLVVTNYGFHISKLNKFELLGSLSDLKRIRLENISVPCLCKLMNLRKLSLHMCSTKQAFESCPMDISVALPNLVELNIDYCKDLVKLPAEICKIKPLKKVSITNCHKFSELPEEIGNLENLEVLRLSSCSNLEEMPGSIKRLHKLSHLDISDCISLKQLPEDFGFLCNLERLYMRGCSRCELPVSAVNLLSLAIVICDEETAASWEPFQPQLPNLTIEQLKADINLDWLQGV